MTRALSIGLVLVALVWLPGCGILLNALRDGISSGGGPLAELARVRGNTSGARSRWPIGCGAAASSPQHAYEFVAPRSATYTFDSTTSDYDGVLAVFGAGGQELACNDDHGGTRASQVAVALHEGQAVQVVQGGYSGRAGHYELWVTGQGGSPAATLAGADGTPLPVAPPQPLAPDSSVSGDTTGQPPIAGIDCPPASPMQEWSFTPTEDASYLFQVDSEHDGYLGLLAQGATGAIACNDDWTDTRHSRVAADLVAGTTYRVIVGGFAQQSGGYTLTAITLAQGGPLRARQPVLFAAGTTSAQPDVCGAPPGSVDRTFTFSPPTEAFYSVYSDAPAWLVVSDGRRVIACLRLGPEQRAGLALKSGHRYQMVLELGASDGAAHFFLVEEAAPDAPDWQVPPAAPPIASVIAGGASASASVETDPAIR